MRNPFDGTHLSDTSLWFPKAPIRYEGNRILLVNFKTSGDILQFLTPKPLVVNPSHLATIYIGALQVVQPIQLRYYEAGIFIPVSYDGMEGHFMPVLYLDQALAILVGREVWGFPKFQADFQLEASSDSVHAAVTVEGTQLIEMVAQLGEPVPPTLSFPSRIVLSKSIPSAAGATDVKQLTTAMIRDGSFTEVRPARSTLRLGSTPLDPLGSIPVLEIVGSAYTTGGFALDYGEILHDYLNPRP